MPTPFEKKKQRHASGESTMSQDSVSNYIPTPPDGGYGWVIVLASFMNHVIVDGISFTFGVFYMEFLEYYQASKAETALVGSLLCGVYLLTGIVASALTNKFGCRGVCIVGSFIASAAFVLCTFSPNIHVLMLTYGVMGGFGFGLVYLPSVVSVSFYFQKRRALATGIAVCGAGVGCFLFAPAGRILLDTFHWKSAMLIVAATVLNSCVCGMLMRPLEPVKRKRRPRAKNILDRLKEHASTKFGKDRNRKESECSACAYSVHDPHSIKQRVQEVKFAREKMLHDEDSESEMGSMMNSVHLGDSRGPSRNSSIVAKDNKNLLRQNSLVTQPIEEANHNGVNAEHTSPTLPTIIVESEAPTSDEKTGMLAEEREQANKAQPKIQANGHISPVDKLKKESNGFANMNGSLPNGLGNTKHMDSLVPQQQLGLSPETSTCRSVSYNQLWDKKARRRWPQGVHKEDYARPLYRKDIFYSGSVLNIAHFNSQPDVKTYIKSVTSIPTAVPPEKESCIWGCLRVPKAAKDILKEMLDVSLLTDPVFLVAAIANAFGMLGMYVPFIFVADRAISLGIEENKAAFLLSVIGITNTLGRIAAGAVADLQSVSPLLLHNIAVLGCGVTCLLNMFCTTYPLMCVQAAVFGLCIATWISLTSIILCNLLGLDKLTNAFGLLTMVRGVFVIAGPPLAGAVYEATGDYDMSFHIGGGVLVVTSFVFFTLHLPFFTRRSLQNIQEGMIVEETVDPNIPSPPDSDEEDEEAFESEGHAHQLTAAAV